MLHIKLKKQQVVFSFFSLRPLLFLTAKKERQKRILRTHIKTRFSFANTKSEKLEKKKHVGITRAKFMAQEIPDGSDEAYWSVLQSLKEITRSAQLLFIC